MPNPDEKTANLPEARQPQRRRLVMKSSQTMSFSTAIFYLQSKPEVDDEYRRIVEAMLDGIIRHTGMSGVALGEFAVDNSTEA